MLEEKINLLKSIREEKPKDFVKEKFTAYCSAYSKMSKPNEKDIQSYKDIHFLYTNYMNKGK